MASSNAVESGLGGVADSTASAAGGLGAGVGRDGQGGDGGSDRKRKSDRRRTADWPRVSERHRRRWKHRGRGPRRQRRSGKRVGGRGLLKRQLSECDGDWRRRRAESGVRRLQAGVSATAFARSLTPEERSLDRGSERHRRRLSAIQFNPRPGPGRRGTATANPPPIPARRPRPRPRAGRRRGELATPSSPGQWRRRDGDGGIRQRVGAARRRPRRPRPAGAAGVDRRGWLWNARRRERKPTATTDHGAIAQAQSTAVGSSGEAQSTAADELYQC